MARPDVDPSAGASEPRLLHADEDRLRLVAAALARGGRFGLIVADTTLWPAALEFLRERLPDHTFVERAPASAEEASRALSDPLRDTPGTTIVLRVDGREAGPIEALNLRRESLSRAAANFVVVLEGDAAHSRFLQEAPDCYSYRDVLAVLEGEPSLDLPEHPEGRFEGEVDIPRLVAEARKAAPPHERAARSLMISRQLRDRGATWQARELLDEVIATVESPGHEPGGDAPSPSLLAQIYSDRSDLGSHADRFRWLRRARALLARTPGSSPWELAKIDRQAVDAIGLDLAVLRRAHESRSDWPLDSLSNLALAYCAREDLVRAREVLAEIDAYPHPMLRRLSSQGLQRLLLLIHQGAWPEAARLTSPTGHERPAGRQVLDRWRAALLLLRGELDAAQRAYAKLPPCIARELGLARIAAERGHAPEARIEVEQVIDRPRAEDERTIDDLLEIHGVLLFVSELELALDPSAPARAALDARLAALRLHIEHTEDPDPPWPLIHCLVLGADAYLKRLGAERLALSCAEEALHIAGEHSSVLVPGVARRLVVASLRLGELDQARAWLDHGLARAREHEHRGEEARLRGLALWHAALANGDVGRAEADMRAAIAATGSVLVEASVLARIGTALARRDLLQRAQQIYRSLPWPAREGACLEALGETRIAEARYRTFGLAARLASLQRRSGPPPITADDEYD